MQDSLRFLHDEMGCFGVSDSVRSPKTASMIELSVFAIVAIGLTVGGCAEETPEDQARKDAARHALAVERDARDKQTGRLSSADRILVCRAAIATAMGQPISIVEAAKVDSATIHTVYRRPSDGTVWRTACRIVRNRVVWASIREDGTLGRWRDHPSDSVVTFTLDETSVSVAERHDDGSATLESFSR